MREFIATERCDRCGAQAKYAATKAGCAELLFCGHHYRENRDALINQYWLINSDEPLAQPKTAAVYTE